MDLTTGIVLGATFGSVFVITCVISAVKAVRDRKRIKARIAERERIKAELGIKPKSNKGKTKVSIEERPSSTSSDHTKNGHHKSFPNGKHGHSSDKLEVPMSSSFENGVDNLTYTHSQTDIERGHIDNKNAQTKSKLNTADLVPLQTKRTFTNEIVGKREKINIRHLSPECLAVQKMLRRHSYEMAVCEHSWLPMEMPSFASSNQIVNTYNYGVVVPKSFSSTVGFENRAFNQDDYKKT